MTAMAFSIRRIAPSRRWVYQHVFCYQSTAIAFSIRRVAPSPRCVYRHILCHQAAAMAFSIRRVAPSLRCVVLCLLSARVACSVLRVGPALRCGYRVVLFYRSAGLTLSSLVLLVSDVWALVRFVVLVAPLRAFAVLLCLARSLPSSGGDGFFNPASRAFASLRLSAYSFPSIGAICGGSLSRYGRPIPSSLPCASIHFHKIWLEIPRSERV